MIRYRAGFVLASAALVLTAIGANLAEARDIKVVRKAPAVVKADPAPASAEAESPTVAAIAAPVSPCARKVKVIYTGYGEADRADCSPATKSTIAVR